MTVCTDRHIPMSWVHMGQDKYVYWVGQVVMHVCTQLWLVMQYIRMSCPLNCEDTGLYLTVAQDNITDDH